MKIIKQFSIKRQWTNSRGETKLNSNGDLVYFYDHYALGDDGKLYHQATTNNQGSSMVGTRTRSHSWFQTVKVILISGSKWICLFMI